MTVVVFEVEPRERAAFERIGQEHQLEFTNQLFTLENATSFSNAEIGFL